MFGKRNEQPRGGGRNLSTSPGNTGGRTVSDRARNALKKGSAAAAQYEPLVPLRGRGVIIILPGHKTTTRCAGIHFRPQVTPRGGKDLPPKTSHSKSLTIADNPVITSIYK